MARPTSEALTAREAQIMDVLWGLEAATAEQVREQLPDRPHDSTVRTLLRVLVEKGYVSRDDRGTAYTYRPAVEREKAQKTALRHLLGRLFGGSAESLVLRLIEDEQLRPDQLEEIRRAVEKGSDTKPNKRKRRSS
jgi:predicted transcriptional regulator